MAKQNVAILIVDDDADVLESIYRDLSHLEHLFLIETAASADDARKIIADLKSKDVQIGLILCDHLMPKENGVEFMSKLQKDVAMTHTRKVLVTAHANLEDTINAVNQANLNYYISKPWESGELKRVAKHELTNFVVAGKEDLMKYMSVLETETILNVLQGMHSID